MMQTGQSPAVLPGRYNAVLPGRRGAARRERP
jgi:hypothetical protein